MMIRALILASALLVPFVATRSAAAATFEVPATTTQTYIGMVSGKAYAAHLRPAGCLWTKLAEGPLSANTTIKGLPTGERMYVVQSTTTVCNFSMSVLSTNGWGLTLNGEGGNDLISGGTKAVTLDGGDGHDTIWGYGDASFTSHFRGGYGDDIILSSGTGVLLAGNEGSDRLCVSEPAQYVLDMDGGPGVDRGCGTAYFYNSISMNVNCPQDCAVF